MTGLCAPLIPARIFFAYRVADFLRSVAVGTKERTIYGKLFDSMYDGTLAGHWQAIVTLQQLVILANADGTVDMTVEAIARRTTIPERIISAGIAFLLLPDKYSRTPGEDGKRIVPLDDHRPWGWRLVNHWKYKGLRDMDQKREADRARLADKRKRNNDVAIESPSVAGVANVAHADAYADEDTKIKNTVGLKPDDARRQELERTRELRRTAFDVIKFLNEKAGKNYQPVKSNIDLIVARLREGGTADDMRAIIAKKCREWQGRDGMEEYLRPATLFGSKNFWQKYQGELPPQ